MMMNRLCEMVKSWWQDDRGVTSIEYVMLASLIAMVIIASVDVLGDRVCGRFKSVAEALGTAAIITCS